MSVRKTYIPVRCFELSGVDLEQLDRETRRVYCMIDGKKEIVDIALLLRLSTDRIETVLAQLINSRTVSMKTVERGVPGG